MVVPQKFKDRMKEMLGDDFDNFISALEENEAVRALRVNTLKTKISDFEACCDFRIDALDVTDGDYRFYEEKIGGHPLHHAGAFYVQDPSAMAPVAAASEIIWPGMKVLDMCAAPGGKTSQLASLLCGEGVLVSNEIVPARARILMGNVERMGVKNAVVTNLSPEDLALDYEEYFDFVLCDAPCSGEGMFRKYEVACEEWSEENVLLCAERQKDILENAAKTVGGGGYLMYSTCTFSKEENEDVISSFLEKHHEFQLVPVLESVVAVTAEAIGLGCARRFYPHINDGEGQFLALLKKEEGPAGDVSFKSKLKPLTKEDRAVCEDFLVECIGYVPSGLAMHKDNVVIADRIDAPDGAFSCGVTLGEVVKGRVVPHHHFFSAYGKEFIHRVDLEMSDVRLSAYLRGEQIYYDIENGWCSVSVCGVPIGGGKAVDGFVKNHYPKGLRNKT